MSTTGRPAVSVVIPCYNLGAYLDEAVQSVLAQTFQDFEIVIVNDGSTDPATNELLFGYRRPKTRVVQSDNRGLPAARNLAMAHSFGRYLCALDADDKLSPTFLEKTTAILDADPGLTFVSCWLQTFDGEEWVWRQDRCDLLTLLCECTVATPSLVRTAAVREVGGYDERMAKGYEDWDLWITLVERGLSGTIIPEVLFHYRRRPGSMSSTCCHGDVHLELMRYLVAKHESSYRRHLVDVLANREAVSCGLLKETYALDREIEGRLVPMVERRREELSRLQRRVELIGQRDSAAAEVTRLEAEIAESRLRNDELGAELAAAGAELATAKHEAMALRNSGSWRLTAPIRRALDLVEGLRGRRSPGRSSVQPGGRS